MTPSQTLRKCMLQKNTNLFQDLLYLNGNREIFDRWTEEQRAKAGIPVRVAINGDRRLTIRIIAIINWCSKSSVHPILHKNLNMSRVCPRWVPRLLSDEEKETPVRLSTQFFLTVCSRSELFEHNRYNRWNMAPLLCQKLRDERFHLNLSVLV